MLYERGTIVGLLLDLELYTAAGIGKDRKAPRLLLLQASQTVLGLAHRSTHP